MTADRVCVPPECRVKHLAGHAKSFGFGRHGQADRRKDIFLLFNLCPSVAPTNAAVSSALVLGGTGSPATSLCTRGALMHPGCTEATNRIQVGEMLLREGGRGLQEGRGPSSCSAWSPSRRPGLNTHDLGGKDGAAQASLTACSMKRIFGHRKHDLKKGPGASFSGFLTQGFRTAISARITFK
jgi:hypothetical protein